LRPPAGASANGVGATSNKRCQEACPWQTSAGRPASTLIPTAASLRGYTTARAGRRAPRTFLDPPGSWRAGLPPPSSGVILHFGPTSVSGRNAGQQTTHADRSPTNFRGLRPRAFRATPPGAINTVGRFRSTVSRGTFIPGPDTDRSQSSEKIAAIDFPGVRARSGRPRRALPRSEPPPYNAKGRGRGRLDPLPRVDG